MFRLLFLYAFGLVLILGGTNVLALPFGIGKDKGKGSSVKPSAIAAGHTGRKPFIIDNGVAALRNEEAKKAHKELGDIFNRIDKEESKERAKEHYKASGWHDKEAQNRRRMEKFPETKALHKMTAYESEMNGLESKNDALTSIANYNAYVGKSGDHKLEEAAAYYKKFDEYADYSLRHMVGTDDFERADPKGNFKKTKSHYDKALNSREKVEAKTRGRIYEMEG